MAERAWSLIVATGLLLARAISVYFIFIGVLGLLWFRGSHDALTQLYLVASILALLVFAAYPRKLLVSPRVRVLIAVVAGAGIIATVPQMYRDLTLVNGPDYGPFWVRALQCVVLAVMASEAIAWPRFKFAV